SGVMPPLSKDRARPTFAPWRSHLSPWLSHPQRCALGSDQVAEPCGVRAQVHQVGDLHGLSGRDALVGGDADEDRRGTLLVSGGALEGIDRRIACEDLLLEQGIAAAMRALALGNFDGVGRLEV